MPAPLHQALIFDGDGTLADTTSPVNIAALRRTVIGPDWRQYFMVIEDASTASCKKPHPQVYPQTLQRLQLPFAGLAC